jgi:carboxylate-amine ligase
MLAWFVDDVVDELGSRQEVEYAFKIMREGTSADRQLATFERTGDLKAVVDRLIAETAEGVRPATATGVADAISPDHAPPPRHVTSAFVESQPTSSVHQQLR